MKFKFSVIALSSLVSLAACEQKAEDKAPEAAAEAPKAGEGDKPAEAAAKPEGAPAGGMAQGAASGGGAAAQPAAAPVAPSPWASRDKTQAELQGKLDAVATKVEAFKKKAEGPAHKANKKVKEQTAALHTKVEAARLDLKNLAGSTEATFTDLKTKAEKSVQDLELAFEQASGSAGTN